MGGAATELDGGPEPAAAELEVAGEVEGGALVVREADDLGADEDGCADVGERLGRADVLCRGGGLVWVAEWVEEELVALELAAPEVRGELFLLPRRARSTRRDRDAVAPGLGWPRLARVA